MAPTTHCPTPNWGGRGNTQLPNKQRGEAVHQGTPRNATGRLIAAIPIWGLSVFCRIPPNIPNIFGARHHPLPTPNWGRQGNTKLPKQQRAPRNRSGRQGTLRNVAGRHNLSYATWNPLYAGGFVRNSPIFSAPYAHSQRPNGGSGKYEITARAKGRR